MPTPPSSKLHAPSSRSEPLGVSDVWRLQREFYQREGIDAWSQGEVPHYITNTPALAKTYAELILGLLRDIARQGTTSGRVYGLELGAGHGGLAFRILEYMAPVLGQSAESLPQFCYVLSDFSDTMASFWLKHPRLKPYFDRGWLDWAAYDMASPSDLVLQQSGVRIQPNDLEQPLVIIANYVFDTIPQDLFRIHGGDLARAHVTLHRTIGDRVQPAAVEPQMPDSIGATPQTLTTADGPESLLRRAIEIQFSSHTTPVSSKRASQATQDPPGPVMASQGATDSNQPSETCVSGLTTGEVKHNETLPRIEDMQWRLSYEPIQAARAYGDPFLGQLLSVYAEQLESTYLFVPHVGLRCLDSLRTLSRHGIMLLSADKGEHRLHQLDHVVEPAPVHHGSFSLWVNFHAFQEYCSHHGGRSFFPRHPPTHLNVACLLMVPDAPAYESVSSAYEAFVDHFGPDAMFILKDMVDYRPETLLFPELMMLFRTSGYDPRFLELATPHLKKLSLSLTAQETDELVSTLKRIWAAHYELDKDDTVGTAVGLQLIALGAFGEAVQCFEAAMQWCGRTSQLLHNATFCYLSMGDYVRALAPISELLEHNPADPTALRMKALCDDALSAGT